MSAVISFDYGQTLAELDADFLSRRVAEHGARVDPERIRSASGRAWQTYNDAKRQGLGGREAWCLLMAVWLEGAGLARGVAQELAEWLWTQQPEKNLWRQPIADMFELVTELQALGVPRCIVSNSEGRLRGLVEELGQASHFPLVIDSGLYDFEKPDARMFELAASHFGRSSRELIHIGDSWEADVLGAVGAGARAVWYAPSDARELPDGVRAAKDAAEVRRALESFGVRLSN